MAVYVVGGGGGLRDRGTLKVGQRLTPAGIGWEEC